MPTRQALPGRGRQCTCPGSERPIDAEADIAARIVLQIIPGEAARQRDLVVSEMRADEATAAACVIFLVAERAALDPERQLGPDAEPETRENAISLERGAV